MKNRKCLAKAKTTLSNKRTLNPLFQQQLTFHEDYHGCILQVSSLAMDYLLPFLSIFGERRVKIITIKQHKLETNLIPFYLSPIIIMINTTVTCIIVYQNNLNLWPDVLSHNNRALYGATLARWIRRISWVSHRSV